MTHKPKRKKSISIIEFYEIEVENWEVDYHFGMNIAPKDLITGVYWEGSTLILLGKLISPGLKKVNKTRIEIAGDPEMDDHWQSQPTIISAKVIGSIVMTRGNNELIFNCSVPARSLTFITMALQSGKIKYISITGTKLKWNQGTISRISLATQKDDD